LASGGEDPWRCFPHAAKQPQGDLFMNMHSAGAVAFELVLVPACLSVVFLLLLFGIVVAPAVFAKAERAERARRILRDLLPWTPFFGVLLRSRRGGRFGELKELRANRAATGKDQAPRPRDDP
jgi:hypothetical protein